MEHCERLCVHFVLNCFNEAVEIMLRASWSRLPDIVFQMGDFLEIALD